MYLHLFMTMGIVGIGAAVLNVVEHAGEPLPAEVRWLLVGAIATAMLSIALLMRTIRLQERFRMPYRWGAAVTLLAAALTLGLGFLEVNTIPLLAVLNLLMMLPVLYGIKVWIKSFDAEEIPLA